MGGLNTMHAPPTWHVLLVKHLLIFIRTAPSWRHIHHRKCNCSRVVNGHLERGDVTIECAK